MTFGEMVKYARKQLSMTQTELAKALGVSFATVNRWENGQPIICSSSSTTFMAQGGTDSSENIFSMNTKAVS